MVPQWGTEEILGCSPQIKLPDFATVHTLTTIRSFHVLNHGYARDERGLVLLRLFIHS